MQRGGRPGANTAPMSRGPLAAKSVNHGASAKRGRPEDVPWKLPHYTQVPEPQDRALATESDDLDAEIAAVQARIAALALATEQAEAAIERAVDEKDAELEAAAVELDDQLLAPLRAKEAAQTMRRGRLHEDLSNATRDEEHYDEQTTLRLHKAKEMREKDLPKTEKALAAATQTLESQKTIFGEDEGELAQLQAQCEAEQSSTYGLSAECAALVTQMKADKAAAAALQKQCIESEIERRTLYNQYEELKGTIRVYSRIKGGDDNTANFRYPTRTDPAEPAPLDVVQTRPTATSIGMREEVHPFKFDHVFGPQASQRDVFNEVGTLVDTAVDGYKVCIMAYGQTGSGKTFTMEGSKQLPGLIPRSIEKVFARAQALAADGWQYHVTCTFVEIYNDQLRNLLEPDPAYHKAFLAGQKELLCRHNIVHHGKQDTTITNVDEFDAKTPADVMQLLDIATKNRSTAATKLNERSSRSHCVFTMRINGSNPTIKQRSHGGLCLVDLAGSERVNESGVSGAQLKEAIAINRSLMHLGDCINALGTSGVPSWRNSKLTNLLQNYLAGDGAKMLMFVMVSNRNEHVSETLNTLRFGAKANNTQIGPAKKQVALM